MERPKKPIASTSSPFFNRSGNHLAPPPCNETILELSDDECYTQFKPFRLRRSYSSDSGDEFQSNSSASKRKSPNTSTENKSVAVEPSADKENSILDEISSPKKGTNCTNSIINISDSFDLAKSLNGDSSYQAAVAKMNAALKRLSDGNSSVVLPTPPVELKSKKEAATGNTTPTGLKFRPKVPMATKLLSSIDNPTPVHDPMPLHLQYQKQFLSNQIPRK